MGMLISRTLGKLFGKKDARIVMVGLDGAGKTTILHKLAYNENVETVPTIGFTLQQVKHGKLSFDVWDIGGQSELRHLWKHYYAHSDALIFVVDSADTLASRKAEGQGALEGALQSDELKDVPLLVLANKQDLSGAMKKEAIAEFLGLAMLGERQWYVQECSAVTGKGLVDGLQWLSDAVEVYWQKTGKK